MEQHHNNTNSVETGDSKLSRSVYYRSKIKISVYCSEYRVLYTRFGKPKRGPYPSAEVLCRSLCP